MSEHGGKELGLNAAIEALAERFGHGHRDGGLSVVFLASDGHNSIRSVSAVEAAEVAVRAASSHIKKAALLAAADDWPDWMNRSAIVDRLRNIAESTS